MPHRSLKTRGKSLMEYTFEEKSPRYYTVALLTICMHMRLFWLSKDRQTNENSRFIRLPKGGFSKVLQGIDNAQFAFANFQCLCQIMAPH